MGLNLKIGYFRMDFVILILQNLGTDLIIQSYPESRSKSILGIWLDDLMFSYEIDKLQQNNMQLF